jgi:hypothetical protein
MKTSSKYFGTMTAIFAANLLWSILAPRTNPDEWLYVSVSVPMLVIMFIATVKYFKALEHEEKPAK